MHKLAIADFDSISMINKKIFYNTLDRKIAEEADFSLFYQALNETGLIDSLKPYQDKNYNYNDHKNLITVHKENNQWFYHQVPLARRFAFTVLMESNQTFAAAGINNLNDLKSYASLSYDQVYPTDATVTNPKNPKNSLNRFIAYHIINKDLSYEHFIDRYDTDHMIKTFDLFEYIEPLSKNTLIEIRKDRVNGETNLINSINSDATIRITNRRDMKASNGVFHEIDKIMTFNLNIKEYLSKKPLRFDFASFFPELTNNKMRGVLFEQNTNPMMYRDQTIIFMLPSDYLSRMKLSSNAQLGYLAGYPRFQNYMADELNVYNIGKNADPYWFSLKTLPVPAGKYEIRVGILTNGKRGVPDISIDGVSIDRLLNWNTVTSDPNIGYIIPGSNPLDPLGFENDKLMHNHGYMKAPASFKVVEHGWTTGENARYSNANLRVILGVFDFKETMSHELKVDMIAGGEFMLDYIEFVPVDLLESESIY